MFKTQIDQIKESRARATAAIDAIAKAEKFWRNFVDLDGARFVTPERLFPGGYSWLDVLAMARRSLEAFLALHPSVRSPCPLATIANLTQALSEIEDQCPQIEAHQRIIAGESRPVRISGHNAVLVAADGTLILDFSSIVPVLMSAADSLAVSTSQLGSLINLSAMSGSSRPEPELFDFSGMAILALGQAEQSSTKAKDILKTAEENATKILEILDSAKAKLAASEDLASRATAATLAASENAATVNSAATANAATAAAKLDEITRIAAQAETVHSALTSYSATLEDTKSKVAATESKANIVVEEIAKQNEKVLKLIEDAEKMVSGATVAGLAKAFGDEKVYLETSMKSTLLVFFVGIFFLTLTSFGLASYVLHIPISIMNFKINSIPKIGDPGYEVTVAGVLSRTIILIGPFWLTLFSARRYRSLFDLRQQYSHKYNMAFSMNGFKNQSPENAQNIAAWVFSIVANNPSSQKLGGPMDEAPSTSISDLVNGAASQIGKVFSNK